MNTTAAKMVRTATNAWTVVVDGQTFTVKGSTFLGRFGFTVKGGRWSVETYVPATSALSRTGRREVVARCEEFAQKLTGHSLAQLARHGWA